MQTDLSFDLTGESGFSYSCNRCKKCCHDKRISLSPYEILRLARNLRLTTKEFISQFTEEQGTILRFRSEDGACSLLGEEGCTVHADRPGVCRIYPLGGFFQLEGQETFALLAPHPESLGVYGTPATFKQSDTVASFLDAQGIAPYHRANKRYVELLTRLVPLIAECVTKQPGNGANQAGDDSTEPTGDLRVAAVCSESEIAEWFDVDTVVKNFCSKENIPIPSDLDTQIELHIRAMEEWAQSLNNSADLPQESPSE
jgi:Fe-S-cluster containining protein